MSESNSNPQQEQIPIIDDLLSEDDQLKQLENDLQAKIGLETTDNEDENDSDYEDIEDDETTKENDENDICVNIKPRSLAKKDQESEQSEDSTDETENQNVPNIQSKKTEVLPDDDDNNTQSPAYVPRKGKFYEHDDRTADDSPQSKQEISRNKSRFYRDSDAKWQHDLYFQDQKISNSRRSHSHFEHRSNHPREQFQLNDYMSQPYKPRRQNPTNNFDFTDYNRPVSTHRPNSNHYSNDTPKASRPTKGDHDQHQIDERTFHRRRNFINSQYQQHDATPRNVHSNRTNRDLDRYALKTNLPPRLQFNQNQSNIERPKRYSNMRNHLPQQQGSLTKVSNSKANEQNEWPQAPPLPTPSLPQQLITPQMFYQQQTSRYVPLNYSQTSISEQFQRSK